MNEISLYLLDSTNIDQNIIDKIKYIESRIVTSKNKDLIKNILSQLGKCINDSDKLFDQCLDYSQKLREQYGLLIDPVIYNMMMLYGTDVANEKSYRSKMGGEDLFHTLDKTEALLFILIYFHIEYINLTNEQMNNDFDLIIRIVNNLLKKYVLID